MDSLPNDIELLKKLVMEKENKIQELLLDIQELKKINIKVDACIEESDIQLEDDSESVTLKNYQNEDDDDDGDMLPNLGENFNPADFMNILKMIMQQNDPSEEDPSEDIPSPDVE
jgi:hypothetical protein